MLLRRFRLDARKKMFTISTIKYCNKRPREVIDSPALDSFKTQHDRVLGHVI